MKITFPFSAGALVRKEAIFQLKKAAQIRGLSFSSIDDGGWFSTDYYITIEGPDALVQNYLQAAARWSQRVSTE
jgi:hypothetical protein